MALIRLIELWFGAVLAKMLSSVAEREVNAWAPFLAKGLTHLAVRHLPEDLRVRFAEEWQAHLNEVPGQVSKAIVALGFLVAASRLRLKDWTNHCTEEWRELISELNKTSAATAAVVQAMRSLVHSIHPEGDPAIMGACAELLRFSADLDKIASVLNSMVTENVSIRTLVYAFSWWAVAQHRFRSFGPFLALQHARHVREACVVIVEYLANEGWGIR